MYKIHMITLCSGYDAQMLAARRLEHEFPTDITFQLTGWSEIDKSAIKAHNALFPEYKDLNLGDLTKIDWEGVKNTVKCDLMTYSTPCQSVSIAGRNEGLVENSNTKSSIIWNVKEAVHVMRPKYLLFENVKNILSHKHLPEFQRWMRTLEDMGYNNFVKVLNAKDYGVPQNRERVFMVSILGNGKFYFPEKLKTKHSLKDILEDNVDEKYYLQHTTVENRQKKNLDKIERDCGHLFKPVNVRNGSISNTITTRHNRDTSTYIDETDYPPHTHSLAEQVQQACKNRRDRTGRAKLTNNGNIIGFFYRKGKRASISEMVIKNENNTANALTTSIAPKVYGSKTKYRIRRLTERESFRLMDVDDECIDKIQAAKISKTQQYVMAGNSIVVSCIYHILKNIFINNDNYEQQLQLF